MPETTTEPRTLADQLEAGFIVIPTQPEGWVTTQTRPCVVCGVATYVMVPSDRFAAYGRGAHVQDLWPEATKDERELVVTGTHPECWAATFGSGDEEE